MLRAAASRSPRSPAWTPVTLAAGGRRPGRADRPPDDPRLPRSRGEGDRRQKVLVPDSAHGTNPARPRSAGYETVPAQSDAAGEVDLRGAGAATSTTDVAALMITVPEHARPVRVAASSRSPSCATTRGAQVLHGRRQPERARSGIVRPGDLGFDVDAHQPAQDLLDAARRRRPGRGPGRRCKSHLEPFLPVAGRWCDDGDELAGSTAKRPQVDRQAAVVPRQLRHPGARATPTSAPWGRRACAR